MTVNDHSHQQHLQVRRLTVSGIQRRQAACGRCFDLRTAAKSAKNSLQQTTTTNTTGYGTHLTFFASASISHSHRNLSSTSEYFLASWYCFFNNSIL
jgi:hypothetical protein